MIVLMCRRCINTSFHEKAYTISLVPLCEMYMRERTNKCERKRVAAEDKVHLWFENYLLINQQTDSERKF